MWQEKKKYPRVSVSSVSLLAPLSPGSPFVGTGLTTFLRLTAVRQDRSRTGDVSQEGGSLSRWKIIRLLPEKSKSLHGSEMGWERGTLEFRYSQRGFFLFLFFFHLKYKLCEGSDSNFLTSYFAQNTVLTECMHKYSKTEPKTNCGWITWTFQKRAIQREFLGSFTVTWWQNFFLFFFFFFLRV